MNVGLYRAAVAMVSHERRLDAIATNLANVGTVGYKRVGTAANEFRVVRGRGQARGMVVRSKIDFSQGNLRRTEREYDLALWGDGFFAVDSPDGEVYTRDGDLRLTFDGVLVTDEGWPVAWTRRSASIDATGRPVTVRGDGVVVQGTTRLGQLRIVDFVDQGRLRQGEYGYWHAPADLAKATHTATVHQYSLEESNSSGVEEMIAMIGVQRAFESAANLLSSIDESYRRLTRPF